MKNILLNPVTKLTSSTVMGTGLTFILLPIITRIFSKGDFGELSLWSSSLGFALSLVFFHADRLILTEPEKLVRPVLKLNFTILFMGTAFFSLILFLLQNSEIYSFGEIPIILIYLFPVALLVQGVGRCLKNALIRAEGFNTIAFSAVGNSISTSASKIGLGLLSAGSNSLAVSDILGDFISVVISSRKAISSLPEKTGQLTRAISVLLDNLKILVYGQASTFLNSLAQLLPVHVVTSFYGVESAGLFALSLRVSSLPLVHLGRARSDVYQGEFGSLIRDLESEEVKDLFLRRLIRDFWLGGGIYLILGVCPLFLFVTIFGEDWSGGGSLVAVLCFWQFSAFLVSPFGMILILMKKQKKKFIYDFATVGASAGVILGGSLYALEFFELVSLLAALNFLSYAVYLMVIFSEVKAFAQNPYSNGVE